MTSFNYDRPPLGSPRDLLLALVCLLVIALFAVFASGCEDGHHSSSDAAAPRVSNNSDSAAVVSGVSGTGGAAAAASDPLPPGAVRWCYGGFDGSRARHDDRCRISSLRVNIPSDLTLKWNTGVPGDWAHSGGLVIFALFFQAPDGSWKGGKIDWIDTSRSSRDLKNPAAGYGGWNWAEYLAAKKHAAVVVSADGRQRSNWIFD